MSIDIEELKAVADDRNDKYILFLKLWRDLLQWHINYILSQSKEKTK